MYDSPEVDAIHYALMDNNKYFIEGIKVYINTRHKDNERCYEEVIRRRNN